MAVYFKHEKINSFYAMMAAFLIVCESILILWMLESEADYERIISGLSSVVVFIFFLVIIFKIFTHKDNKVEPDNLNQVLSKITNTLRN